MITCLFLHSWRIDHHIDEFIHLDELIVSVISIPVPVYP